MNTYEPGCNSSQTPKVALVLPGAGAGPGHDVAVDAGALDQFARGLRVARGSRDRRTPLGRCAQVLRRAMVRVQAAKAQARLACDRLGERQRRGSGRNAAAMRTDIDLDVDIEQRRLACATAPSSGNRAAANRRARRSSHCGRVPRVARASPVRRPRWSAARRGCLRRRRLRPRRSSGSRSRPRPRAICMRAISAHLCDLACGRRRMPSRRPRHRVEVALERIEVDDQRRRLDRVDRIADARRNALRHQ